MTENQAPENIHVLREKGLKKGPASKEWNQYLSMLTEGERRREVRDLRANKRMLQSHLMFWPTVKGKYRA